MMSNSRHGDIKLSNFNKKKKRERAIANNSIATAAVHWTDSVAITTLYSMFLKDALHVLLESTLKYILFPIGAAASIINAALTWRHAHLERNKHGEIKNRNIFSGIIETVSAIAMTTAVVGALVASTVFAVATPIIFTATIGTKSLINTGRALYNVGKGLMIDPENDTATTGKTKSELQAKKKKYYEHAKEHAKGAIIQAVATVAIACVFVFGKFALAGIGVAVGIAGTALAVWTGVKTYMAKKEIKNLEPNIQEKCINDDSDHLTDKNKKTFSQGARMIATLTDNSEATPKQIRRTHALPIQEKQKLLTNRTISSSMPCINDEPSFSYEPTRQNKGFSH